MIKSLKTVNIGPGNVDLKFGDRLNLFTGDNGLGKSFLFDIIWFAHTRTWPNEVDPSLRSGFVAKPVFQQKQEKSTIEYKLSGGNTETKFTYDQTSLNWKASGKGAPVKSGLVFYVTAEGNYCFYDASRTTDQLPAFVFTERELWLGNKLKSNMKGLEEDLQIWRKSNDEQDRRNYVLFLDLLQTLTGDEDAGLGENAMLDKAGSMILPSLNIGIQQSVPVVFLSTAIKRVLGIAYFITWAYGQHQIYARTNLNGETLKYITLLIDELDVHLHPKWQRSILPALLKLERILDVDNPIQLFASTHSPLVMVSAETVWQEGQDCWIDIDIVGGTVLTQTRPFVKLGTAKAHLEGEAFNLPSDRNKEAEAVVVEFDALADLVYTMPEADWQALYDKLDKHVSRLDTYVWRAVEDVIQKRKSSSLK